MVVDEIYDVLVVKFGIGEVFLPKFRKRIEAITWKQFISYVIIEKISGNELAIKCCYSGADSLTKGLCRQHPSILKDKGRVHWISYFYAIINKKQCSRCKSILEYTEFTKDSSTTDSFSSICKICDNTKQNRNRIVNKDAVVLGKKLYYEINKDSILLKRNKYYLLNKDSIIKQKKKYYQENKAKCNARGAKYRASIIQAMPAWANQEKIKQVYKERPDGYHVDHIVPLQGKLVCGLHCEFNLQYLPASENLSKGSRFEVC